MEAKLKARVNGDAERLRAMFAPIPAREVNQAVHDARVRFWSDVILTDDVDAAAGGGGGGGAGLVLDVDEALAKRWVHESLRPQPKGIGLVIKALEQQSELESETTWRRRMTWSFTARASVAIAASVIGLIASTLSDGAATAPDATGRYVRVKLVEATARQLVGKCRQHSQKDGDTTTTLFDMNQLQAMAPQLSASELKLVLEYLQFQKTVLVRSVTDTSVLVKVAQSDDGQPVTISQEDMRLYILKSTLEKLRQQLAQLNAEYDKRVLEAQAAFNRARTKDEKLTAAKYHLQRKKLVRETIQRRELSLNNLESLYLQIIESKQTIDVVQAMSAGTAALKHLLAADLKIDNVDKVMEDMQDAMADAKEVNDAVSQPVNSPDVVIDDDEIEMELEELIAIEKEKQLASLPTISTDDGSLEASLSGLNLNDKDTEGAERTEKTKQTASLQAA